MAEFTIEIDDDGMFDAIEHKVDSAIEEYSQNMDFSDDISDGIGNYYYWDSIFRANMPDLLAEWGYVSQEKLEAVVEREVQEAVKAMQPQDPRTDDIMETLKSIHSLLGAFLGKEQS
tara:strand:- start:167 stop:517 length:351 start_codon:yes stop_codon:yes gene_type:complete